MSNNRKVYSFKSVGQKQNDFDEQQIDVIRQTPVGILTPISFAQSGGTLFSMSFDVATQIKDNLKNLILTNRGERLMMTDLGANLQSLVYEYGNEDVVNQVILNISNTVKKYMPFVELQDFESRVENSINGNTIGVTVRVTYSVPSIGVTNQAVEAVIYTAG
jgi:phage baseplate assembly protein W